MVELHLGDCLEILKGLQENSIDCCVTSPPYWGLRDYGVDGQLGLEKTPEEYVKKVVAIFHEVKKCLRHAGVLFLNLGDTYAANGGNKQSASDKQNTNKGCIKHEVRKPCPGLKPKDLVGIPWRVAFALQADGWYLRQDIIWKKLNPMPESVKDRCTKSHEYIFILAKASSYFFDHEAIKEPAACGWNGSKFDTGKTGANKDRNWNNLRPAVLEKELRSDTESRHRSSIPGGQSLEKNPSGLRSKRSVWESEDHELLVQWLAENKPEILKQYLDTVPDVWDISTVPFKGAHFAVFPPKLARNCILAGCPKNGVVLDPFSGSGTVGKVAKENGRDFKGIELNPEYYKMGEKRIEKAHYQMSF